MKSGNWTEIIENRRPLADLTDFTATGSGEVGGSESDAIGSGKRSHYCSENERRENGRSQRNEEKRERFWVLKWNEIVLCLLVLWKLRSVRMVLLRGRYKRSMNVV
jgi:hypothetical protein